MIRPLTTERRERQAARWREPLRELLRRRVGAAQAITLNEIRAALGMRGRRTAEQVVEDTLADLGFVVVATGRGYYRPTTAAEINAYVISLHRRHRALQLREQAVIALAVQEGWQRNADDVFSEPPIVQPELFSMPVRNVRNA